MKEDLKKERKRGEKKKKSDKTHVKIPLCSKKNPQKQGRILEGGGNFLAGQNIYP